jgi:cell wall-associated NlpC family hydrolase
MTSHISHAAGAVRRLRGAAVLVAVLISLMTPVSLVASPAAASATPSVQVGRSAWVEVSVATLWRTPDSPRAIDAPALARPVRIERWLDGMSTAERRALNGRADTQALLGDRVRVVRLRPGWAKVVVPSQPSQLDPRGYPGWVLSLQLREAPPDRHLVTVTVPRTRLSTGREVGFGTQLPVMRTQRGSLLVRTPTGVWARLRAAATTPLPPTRADLVRSAKQFLGLRYLWGGLSPWGYDCSGLTPYAFRKVNLSLGRSAYAQGYQSSSGTKIESMSDLRRGDIVCFNTISDSDLVDHVAIYLGDGYFIHASSGTSNGKQVCISSLSSGYYNRVFSWGRRPLE